LLHDVLLFDDHGLPVTIGGDQSSDPNRRVLARREGKPGVQLVPDLLLRPRHTQGRQF
jgi:hypothetical protein